MVIVKRVLIHLISFSIVFLNVQAIIFTSVYEDKKDTHDTFIQSNEINKSTINGSTRSSRMMGIDTGNSSTDFEAGMWLMALLGTLAAAVPVAFLSPNLGFKKRSIDEQISFNMILENINKAITVNTTTQNRVHLVNQ